MSGTTRVSRYQKGKTYLEQTNNIIYNEVNGGIGITLYLLQIDSVKTKYYEFCWDYKYEL